MLFRCFALCALLLIAADGSARDLDGFSYDTVMENAHSNPYFLNIFNSFALAKQVDTTLKSKEPLPHKDKTMSVKERNISYFDGNAQYFCTIEYIFYNMEENRSPGSVFFTFDVREKCSCTPAPE